jgi:protein involved in polysaccharide export with SLBB domain
MRWLVVVCSVAVLFAAGCGPQKQAAKEPIFAINDAVAAAPSVAEDGYIIQAGDFLEVNSAESPSANCVGRVDEDGTVALALVGYVRAEGATVEQFTRTLRQLYAEAPGYVGSTYEVNVEVKLGLYLVSGEVTAGGFKTYEEGLSLYDAVVSAGELTANALTDRVFLNRKGTEGREIVRYQDLGQLKEFPLQENDWIVVPYKVEHLLH